MTHLLGPLRTVRGAAGSLLPRAFTAAAATVVGTVAMPLLEVLAGDPRTGGERR